MDWLERYVEAVKRYLPAKQRDDVGDELMSLLREKIEESTPDDSAMALEHTTLSVLKEFGHPLEVAGRYRHSRPLVSESLMPLYRQVLKILALGWFTAWIGATLMSLTGLFAWWPAGLKEFIETFALWSIVLVTLAFHFSDEMVARFDFLRRWDPRSLPPLGPPMSLFENITGLIFNLIGFAILTAFEDRVSWSIFVGDADDAWTTVILWWRTWLVAGMLFQGFCLFAPYWTARKRIFCIVHDLLLASISVWAFANTTSFFGMNFVVLIVGVVALFGAFNHAVGLFSGKDKPENWMERRIKQDLEKPLNDLEKRLERSKKSDSDA